MKYVFRKKIYTFLASIMDGVGYALFGLFTRRGRSALFGDPASILVIRLDHIGDVLLSTAVPKAIKENYPQCRVIFLTSSWAAPLLQGNPFIDEIILYDAPWFSKLRYKRNVKTLGLIGLLKELRGRKINLALGLRGDLRENFMMFGARIPERIGYGVTGGGFFLTKEVEYRPHLHESEHQKYLLRALGIRADGLEPAIYLSNPEGIAFEKRLERIGLAANEDFICFLVGAGALSKEWPAASSDTFIQMFISRFPGHKMVLVGSSQRLLSQMKNSAHDRVVNLVGETSLRELCLLVKKAKAFVGPDSGPTHIAATLGAPTLFLYSGTNEYERWKPLQESASVLRQTVPCAPCHSDACGVSGHPCMSRIMPADVIESLANHI